MLCAWSACRLRIKCILPFGKTSHLYVLVIFIFFLGFAKNGNGQAASWNYTNQTGNLGTTYDWIDCTGGTTIVSGDDVVSNFNWPFSFNFYDNAYTIANQLSVSSNGFIRLDGNASTNYNTASNYNLTSTATQLGQIVGAAIYDGNVNAFYGSWCRYLVTGTSPNRILTIEFNHFEIDWNDVLFTDVQVSYYETSNKVVLKLGTDDISAEGVDMGLHSGVDTYFHKWGEVKSLINNTWIEYTPVPALTVSPTNLDFGYVATNTTSSNLSYTLTGSNLTGDVVITPPVGFKISTTSSAYSASALTLAPSLGKINQIIYVVFNPTVAQDYTGNITHTSIGATQKNISVTGTSLTPTGACDYNNNASANLTVTPCIDMPSRVDNISTSIDAKQYFVMNVIKGLTYEVYTAESPNSALKLTVYEEGNAAGSIIAFSNTNTGNPDSNDNNDVYLSFTPSFSGQVRVLINKGNSCNSSSPSNINTNVNVSGGSNTQDNQLDAGTNTWIGHIYDGTYITHPGNFSSYLGYYTENETFDQSFGGNTNCFSPVNSNGSVRAEVYTDTYAVRYKMNSTKRGLYIADIGSDDGTRLYVDNNLVYDDWNLQGYQNNQRILLSLTGSSNLSLDYYENGGGNRVTFQNLTLVLGNNLTSNITQSLCVGTAGLAISGDIYGSLPSGITLSGNGYQWAYSSTSSTGPWTNIPGASAASFTPNSSSAPFNSAGTYYIIRIAKLSSSNNVSPNTYVGTNESNVATLTVSQQPAVPTSNNNTTTYNGAVQSASATVGAGEAVYWFTSATGNTSSAAPSGTNVGTYTAWAESRNTTSGCISATRTQVTLTINKKDLQVTATAPNIIYGDANPSVTVQYLGFVGSEDASVLDNTGFTVGTDYTQGLPIGTYNTTILIGSATDNNYNFTPLNSSTFVVGKKVLSFTAGNQTRSYGTHDGTITQDGTYTISGFVNGDNSSVVSGLGSVSYTSTYTEATNAGTSGITITPVLTGLSSVNYTLVAVPGSITIVKADQYISCDCVPFSKPLNEFDTIPVGATSSSGLPVTITMDPSSVATLNGSEGNYYLTDIGLTGTVTLYANQAGNSNYNPAAQGTRFFDVTKSNQNISFPAIDDLNYHAGLTLDLDAVATSGLEVSYVVISGPATVAGDILTITGAGEVWVRAVQAGDASYNVAASVSQSFNVSKGSQTISITIQPGPLSASTQITASSTSGLPVTLTLGTGSAATSLDYNAGGNYYTLSGIGTSGNIYIVGNQAGDATFLQAQQIIETIVIGKTNQTINFSPIANQIYSPSLTVPLTATASSSLPVSFSYVSGPATLSGNTLTITGAGTVIVDANQSGDATYNPAPKVTQQFEVGKATPVITQADITKIFGDAAFNITPSSTSGGSFSFLSGNDDVFTISGNTATITGTGTTTLDITLQPTANYSGATKTVLFTVNQTGSTISMTGSTSYTYNDTHQGPATSTVTGSTGAVTYSYEGTGSTSYSPSSMKPIDAGTYAATATVEADDNYSGATSTPYAFTISKADATISVTPYSVTYDGTMHTAVGASEGVSLQSLSGLDLSGTEHTDAGTYNNDPWTFTDVTGNYNDASGTVNNFIGTKNLTVTAEDQIKCFSETFLFAGTEFTSAGLVNLETIENVTLTSAGAASAAIAGTYAITPSSATGGTFKSTNYLITYTDGELLVNPIPSLTGAVQNLPVCEGTSASINLSGLLANSTFSLTYTINNIAQTPQSNLIADASGNSAFATPSLTYANNGQVLQITGITVTSLSPDCTQSFTQDVTLAVYPLPTLASVTQEASVCEGSSAIINLVGLQPGSTFNLTYVIDGDAPILLTGLTADGSGESSFTTAALPLSYNGEILQINSIENVATGCTRTLSTNTVVVVDPLSVGGSAAASDVSVCENSGTSIVLTGYTGSELQWQQSANGTTGWVNVIGGSGETTSTYYTPDLASTTYYRALVTSGNCVSEYSAITSVTVNPLPTLGGVLQTATVCDGSSATINLSGLIPNTTFTMAYTINGGGTTLLTGLLSDGSGNSSFTTLPLTIDNDGEALQVVEIEIESSGCVQSFSQDEILEIDPASDPGKVSVDQNICSGSAPADIILTSEIGVIQWQVSADNINFTDITGATSSSLTSVQMGTLTATTYYRAKVTSGACSSDYSSAVTVTVNPLPTATISGDAFICDDGSSTTISVALTGSSPWEVTTQLDGGDNVTITNIPTSPYTFDVTAAGTYTVSAVSDDNCTGASSGSAKVIVSEDILHTKSNDTTICEGDAATLTISLQERTVKFNGTDGRIDIPNSTDINTYPSTSLLQNRSVALWFNANDVATQQVLYEEGAGVNGFSIFLEGGFINVHAWESNTSWGQVRTAVSTGNWYHVAFVFDAGSSGHKFEGFLDGVSFGGNSDPAANNGLNPHSGDITIGESDGIRFPDNSTASGNYYDGYIDEFKLWNRSLTGGELIGERWNVNDGTKSGANLIVYYNFNGDSEPTITDEMGGNNGTLFNGVTFEQDSPFTPSILWSPGGMASFTVNVTPIVSTNYTYTLTHPFYSCESTGSVVVSVNPLPTVSGLFNVCAESTTELTGSGSPAAVMPWISATPGVATVNNTGVVSGVSAGASVITYTDINGCSVSETITVAPLPVVSISGNTSILIGQTTQLSPITSGTWISNTTSVATVTNGGVVTGVGEGEATFTFTSSTTPNCSATTGVVTVISGFDVSVTQPNSTCNAADGNINSSGTDTTTIIEFAISMNTGNINWNPDWEFSFSLSPANVSDTGNPPTFNTIISVGNVGVLSGSGNNYTLTSIPSTSGLQSVSIRINLLGNRYDNLELDFEITETKTLDVTNITLNTGSGWNATQVVTAIPNTGPITTN